MEFGGQRHAPAALLPADRAVIYGTRGWVGPRVSLDGCGKFPLPTGFDPRTVQPVESRYTDYIVPVHQFTSRLFRTSYSQLFSMSTNGRMWRLCS